MIISITDSCADVVFLKCLPSQHLNEFMFHLFFGKLKYFVDFPTTLLLAYIWIFCFDFNPAELNLQIGFFFSAAVYYEYTGVCNIEQQSIRIFKLEISEQIPSLSYNFWNSKKKIIPTVFWILCSLAGVCQWLLYSITVLFKQKAL